MRMQSLVKSEPPPLTGTPEQQDIWHEMETGSGHLMVNAVAGSGKSTTCVEGSRRVKAGSPKRVIYLAFSKAIQLEMEARAEDTLECRTFHSLGLEACQRSLGAVKVDPQRMWKVIEGMRRWQHGERQLMGGVKRLASLAKQYDATTPAELAAIADHHGLDLGTPDQEQQVIGLVPLALDRASQFARYQVAEVDYDDMCWLPARLDLKLPRVDIALVDEAQDLNHPQQWIGAGVGERVMAVGDSHQAIFGFRGACSDSMSKLSAMLGTLSSDVTNWPLVTCLRCPANHVRIAQALVPAIRCREGAENGVVRLLGPNKVISDSQAGDLVLCRTNAPLFELGNKLLAAGRPTVIRGRDVGEEIVKLLADAEKHSTGSLSDTLHQANIITTRNIARFAQMRGQSGVSRMGAAQDRLQCVLISAEGCDSLAALRAKLVLLFTDTPGSARTKINLSTVHRAKGLEADRVWILRPDLMPHPLAQTPADTEQEMNCLYVALTRSRRDLFFVGGIPSPVQDVTTKHLS